jgi:hypothetical protein
LPKKRDEESGEYYETHTHLNVHVTMLRQICRDYQSLPDPMGMRSSDIRWWYAPLVPELKRAAELARKHRRS